MFRALVLFLILPPLLMPPGMCICQLVPTTSASTTPPSAPAEQPTASHAASPRPDCTCYSCRSQAASGAPEHGDRHLAQTPTEEPFGPEPGKHWPGCPAAVGSAPLVVVLPTVTTPVDLAAITTSFAPAAETVVSAIRAVPVSAPAVSPPLFISHCTLLI